MASQKKVIITGATSGIGFELARVFAERGYKVGATGRRLGRLEDLKQEIGENCHIKQMDVADPASSDAALQELIEEMGGMDIIVLNAGVSQMHEFAPWEVDKNVLDVNVVAFARHCHFAFNYFNNRGYGQIAGISSIASLFNYGQSTVYNASKAFISSYMGGFRQKANHVDADIVITDVKPGFVVSEMTDGHKGMFWVAPTKKASKQIADAIESRKNLVYITKRWRVIAWLLKLIPDWIWNKL